MRIIGYIEHPYLKISVFKMDEKYVVKFESNWCEQIYKFRADEYINGLEAIQQLVDAPFIAFVEQHFPPMHQTRMQAIGKTLPPAREHEFDEII